MLIQLVNYELTKKWMVSRYFLLGYIVLQTVLLMITKIFFWDDSAKTMIMLGNGGQNLEFSMVLTIMLYFFMAGLLTVYPFVESIYRYERDLSGKQSVLELMIPIISWKKIISKLIAAICSTMVCVGISLLSVIAFVVIMGNFNKEFMDLILNVLKEIAQSPLKTIFYFLYMLFGFSSFYMVILFCIAFSKSFSHKNRIAVPMGIGLFIICLGLISVLALQADKFPIVKYSILGMDSSLSQSMLDILVFCIALLGTSWFMEKRIEH